MIIGYARVSTDDQNLDGQLDALKAAGAEKNFADKITGTARSRPELDRLLDQLRPGDVITVTMYDRLARSLRDLLDIVDAIQAQGAGFRSLAEDIDTTTPAGRLVFHVFASIAQFERERISERTKEGLEAARKRGRVGGRPPALSAAQKAEVRRVRDDELRSLSEIAALFRVSAKTIRRALWRAPKQTLPIGSMPWVPGSNVTMAGLILTILLITALYPVLCRAGAVVAMYEFRGSSLAGVVRAAVCGDQKVEAHDLQSKRLSKGRSFYPFGQKVAAGSVLFVGEGNFSFALSLARLRAVDPGGLTATSYEPEETLSETAYDNAQKLIRLGARVRTCVDGTSLAITFPQKLFRLIIFQFPNVASREALYGQNPNHVMITRFLKSASGHLARNGEIVVSTVDSPFYEGAFKMHEAAQKAGLAPPMIYDFDPARFAEYAHQKTENEGSALENHDTFATFAFSRPTS